MEKAREFQKNIYFCFIDYAKAFDFQKQKPVKQDNMTKIIGSREKWLHETHFSVNFLKGTWTSV